MNSFWAERYANPTLKPKPVFNDGYYTPHAADYATQERRKHSDARGFLNSLKEHSESDRVNIASLEARKIELNS